MLKKHNNKEKKNRRAIKSNMNTYQNMSKEWGEKKRKKPKQNRNLNVKSQFITDSLRQHPFMCLKEDKYAFNQFYIVIIIMIII